MDIKKVSLITVFSIVSILGALFIYQSLTVEDPLSGYKEFLSNPQNSGDPASEKNNYVDSVAKDLHQKAAKAVENNDLSAAASLLEKAIDEYQGFHGYHYFEMQTDLAMVYDWQGYRDRASSMLEEVENGLIGLSENDSR